jgi:hypothetical protein
LPNQWVLVDELNTVVVVVRVLDVDVASMFVLQVRALIERDNSW